MLRLSLSFEADTVGRMLPRWRYMNSPVYLLFGCSSLRCLNESLKFALQVIIDLINQSLQVPIRFQRLS